LNVERSPKRKKGKKGQGGLEKNKNNEKTKRTKSKMHVLTPASGKIVRANKNLKKKGRKKVSCPNQSEEG